jgi:acetyltransferase-like isoleucine patch superfamily enzyme
MLSFTTLWHIILIPFLLYIGIGLLYISELLISGSIIKVFNITYKPGIYPYNHKELQFFRWTVICILYTPLRKILEIFPLGAIKNTYYRLLGMKIGTNTLVGGVIKDPCVTEFGNNTTMGEYAIIYGHIHNMENHTIEINKVTIGNNCIIGAGAIIMPGVTIEDHTVIAAGALVPKNQHLKRETIYGGVPAKEISSIKNKKSEP